MLEKIITEDECFSHYELIRNLTQFEEGIPSSKIEIQTVKGIHYEFDCTGKTIPEFMEFFEKLDSQIAKVIEWSSEHPGKYSHSTYTLQPCGWMYYIQMEWLDGTII